MMGHTKEIDNHHYAIPVGMLVGTSEKTYDGLPLCCPRILFCWMALKPDSWRLQSSAVSLFLLFIVNDPPSPLRSRFLLLGHFFSLSLFLLVDISPNLPLMRTGKPSCSRPFLLFGWSISLLSRSFVLSCWLRGFLPRIGSARLGVVHR